MTKRFGVMKIRPDMPGYDSKEGRRLPWLVFSGSQRVRGRAFSSWGKAMKYVAKQFEE